MLGKGLIYNVSYRSCYLCGYKHSPKRAWRGFCKIYGNQACEQCYDLIKGVRDGRPFHSSKFLSIYRTKRKGGYITVRRPSNPRADSYGFVFEHIVVMEYFLSKKLGFKVYLSSEFDIHHKNGDTYDNRIENLQLMTQTEHTEFHKKLYYLSLKHSALLFDLG